MLRLFVILVSVLAFSKVAFATGAVEPKKASGNTEVVKEGEDSAKKADMEENMNAKKDAKKEAK